MVSLQWRGLGDVAQGLREPESRGTLILGDEGCEEMIKTWVSWVS